MEWRIGIELYKAVANKNIERIHELFPDNGSNPLVMDHISIATTFLTKPEDIVDYMLQTDSKTKLKALTDIRINIPIAAKIYPTVDSNLLDLDDDILYPIIVAAGDYETFEKIPDSFELLGAVFEGSAYNKRAIQWLDLIYEKIREDDEESHAIFVLESFIYMMPQTPECIINCDYVYEFLEGKLKDIIHYVRLDNKRDGFKFAFYEFTFQVGYYTYKDLLKMYEKNPNPSLGKWIAITDV